MLPPPAQEMQQSADPAESPRPLGAGEPPSVPGRPRVSLVVFLGGITYGELGALRKLSELEESGDAQPSPTEEQRVVDARGSQGEVYQCMGMVGGRASSAASAANSHPAIGPRYLLLVVVLSLLLLSCLIILAGATAAMLGVALGNLAVVAVAVAVVIAVVASRSFEAC